MTYHDSDGLATETDALFIYWLWIKGRNTSVRDRTKENMEKTNYVVTIYNIGDPQDIHIMQ